ncbi:hypothetical protein PW52_07885 [Tamlana sedimentorum]|uniref:Uncharacterized protein n=1 Tax=Neotamlana sedimentorum TaxID=1435349 RepID=A0A0D7WD35_9FLAO|nr:hypothetical protein [Tamlana sedimentorum]KJD35657.1 hypothetical protein PW52_07885 [Tamlana sedimentorum]
MEKNNSNWSKTDIKIYLLLFFINTDYTVSIQNIDYSRFEIKKPEFDKIYNEFNEDNDYQSIQKIRMALENKAYSKEQINTLFLEIKTMFSLSKKRNNLIINSIFTNLERILNTAA